MAIFGAYTTFEKYQDEFASEGVNTFFNNTSDKRIIIKKKDKSNITEDDYNKINNLTNIDSIVKNDILLDKKSYCFK